MLRLFELWTWPLVAVFVWPLVWGCTGTAGRNSVPLETPRWQDGPLSAQLTVWYARGALLLPLQGGLRLDERGGRLALVLLQGRTLGECFWGDGGLHCRGGAEDRRSLAVLHGVGLAVARLQPALEQRNELRSIHMAGEGWSLRGEASDARDGSMRFHYEGEGGENMDLELTRIKAL